MKDRTFYNAHHSPAGAFASLTLGCKGAKGGFGLELSGPANDNIFIGLESADQPGTFQALPFYGGSESAARDYDVEGHSDLSQAGAIDPFGDSEVVRTMGPSIDTWKAGDLTLTIGSPVGELPEPPATFYADGFEDGDAYLPAVFGELILDNRSGTFDRRAFIGYRGTERYAGMRVLDPEVGLVGIAQGRNTGIAVDDQDAWAGISWQPETILDPTHKENLPFLVAHTGLIVIPVKAGELKRVRVAFGFYREGVVTSGIEGRYLYTELYKNLDHVLQRGIALCDDRLQTGKALDESLKSRLTEDRYFQFSHAIRSYYGSTQLLLDPKNKPLWVVNEGEYRMMNTFDLTVDQLFYELALHPWTVRNVLDLYADRYSYDDTVRFPNDLTDYPGGIAFAHDMGVSNAFSLQSRSGYEQAGLTGCFSFMSTEELMNWVLCASIYLNHTKDFTWGSVRKDFFLRALRSMQNRDHYDPAQRNGLVGSDGSRCKGGAEITTYDSLDASLGQARNNLYLGVKGWATYRLLADALRNLGDNEAAAEADEAASLAANTIVRSSNEVGLLPAIIGEGVEARIIPAIEGLVYPILAGLSLDADDLVAALKRHLQIVLDTGICRFKDGGWRLSSTSRNSWLSKIYLCQFIAEKILGMEPDAQADAAHVGWLMDPENVYFAWSDQMLEGKAVGSRYYPRGVTSSLWLLENGMDLHQIAEALSSSDSLAKA